MNVLVLVDLYLSRKFLSEEVLRKDILILIKLKEKKKFDVSFSFKFT